MYCNSCYCSLELLGGIPSLGSLKGHGCRKSEDFFHNSKSALFGMVSFRQRISQILSGQMKSRPHTTDFPQKVAFWKGNGTPYFRGMEVGELLIIIILAILCDLFGMVK